MANWFVIGISGVSCSGKTTLAQQLYDFLVEYKKHGAGMKMCGQFAINPAALNGIKIEIGTVDVVHQDDYFLPEDHAMHKHVEHLNHINWELITAMDMKRMCGDVEQLLCKNHDFDHLEPPPYGDILMEDHNHHHNNSRHTEVVVNFLILEGFILFEDPFFNDLCNIKFHLHLPYEKCFARRKLRVYKPPDVIGYFETCVWPLYEKYFRERIKDRKDVRLLNADVSVEKCFNYVLSTIFSVLN